MSARLQRNLAFIKLLADEHLTRNQIKSLIVHSTRDNVVSVLELIINVVQGNVNLSEAEYTDLKKHRTDLRKIVSTAHSKRTTEKAATLARHIKAVQAVLRIALPHFQNESDIEI